MAKREIRIQGVPDGLHKKLNNIRKNLGVSMSSMAKTVLFEYAEKQPERLTRDYKE